MSDELPQRPRFRGDPRGPREIRAYVELERAIAAKAEALKAQGRQPFDGRHGKLRLASRQGTAEARTIGTVKG
jgi:hypothetical protein